MNIIKLFTFFCLLIFALSAHSFSFFSKKVSKCQKLEWTKDDGRTQGGGWIWFPGKAMADSLDEAYLKAEGLAIGRYLQECVIPHKEVKIHERCDEMVGNYYRAYVRVSIRDKKCREAKYATSKLKPLIFNKRLMKTYKSYKRLTSKDEKIDDLECSLSNSKNCYQLGKYEFQMGNLKGALKKFDIGCRLSDINACFNAGLTAMELNFSYTKILKYFEMVCNKRDGQGCLFVAHVNSMNDNVKNAGKYIKKSCDLKFPKGCFGAGQFFERRGNIRKALKYYKMACQMKYAESCHQVSVIYYGRGDKKSSGEFALTACNLGYRKACYNYGMMLKSSNRLKCVQFLKKSCEMDLVAGCFELGKIFAKKKPVKALEYFSIGCDFGDSGSCKEASVMSYDMERFGQAINFAKLACKLNDKKSCHNVKFLEAKIKNPK